MPNANTSLILHHYPMSPYAQKIRAMLGYTQLHWQSVTTSEAPPRDMLAPLAGAYRRIPVAQIGADVFCDSQTIAREIAALSGRSELSPESVGEAAQQWIHRAEGRMFFACVVSSVSAKFLFNAIWTLSFSGLSDLMKDRAKMGKAANLKAPAPKEARQMVAEHLQALEAHLSQDFLSGDSPELADFAVYHGLWMIRVQGNKRFIRRFPKVIKWIERIQAFGTGTSEAIEASQALDTALNTEPRAIPEADQQHELIGRRVKVGPNDYAQEATEGKLVGSSDHSWVIAREHPQTGPVHVHFPKEGYDLVEL